ncbi:MAG: hypothetical protein EBS90_07755 [Betaproteobacteria bacterium]|nr:hypothetical protein [Betaproteobacteria bacterium]
MSEQKDSAEPSGASAGSVEEQLRREVEKLKAMLDRRTLDWGFTRLQVENNRLRISHNEKEVLSLIAKTIRGRGWIDWAGVIDGILKRQ